MVPAMDRVTSAPWRRKWVVFGLGVALGTTGLGCAELKSQIFGDSKIGEIGHVQDSNDIYARNNPSGTVMNTPTAITTSNGTQVPTNLMTSVEEAGPAFLPAGTNATDPSSVGGVALQQPRPLDSLTDVKLASNVSGVPNAARMLASAEPRTQVKPAEIVAQAREALEAMTAYEVALHRQERVNGSLLPEEDLVVAIKRSPRSVRLSWPNGPNQGREALYRSDEPGGQMHIKLANPALPRLSLNPESPLVMKNSRHPIGEAGFDSLVEGLENGIEVSALGYAGVETPTGLDRPAHCLTRTTPSGERWKVYLDVQNHLPALIEAVDARGDLVERYVFHDIKPNPPDLATADAFDPNARWGQPKGLLSRLTGDSTPR